MKDILEERVNNLEILVKTLTDALLCYVGSNDFAGNRDYTMHCVLVDIRNKLKEVDTLIDLDIVNDFMKYFMFNKRKEEGNNA